MIDPKEKDRLITELSISLLLERLLKRILIGDKSYGESSESLYRALTLSVPEKLEEARKDFCLNLIENEDQHPNGDTERTMLIKAFKEKFMDDFELVKEAYFVCNQLTEFDYRSLAENLKEKEEVKK